MSLEKRQQKRMKMIVPLRVFLEEAANNGGECYFAHTVEIAETGARLGGLRNQLEPGQIITLQHGHHKSRFRVRWTRQVGPNEQRAGLQSLEPDKNIWGVDLSETLDVGRDQELMIKVLRGK